MINKGFDIKFLSLITIGVFFLSQSIFSQSREWMSEYEINMLKNSRLIYNKPNNFKEVIGGNDCFENNPTLKKILICGGNKLQSNDSSFVVFNTIGTVYTRKPQNDQVIQVLPPKEKTPYTPNTHYIAYIKNDISQSLGKEAALNWQDHVRYYSKEETLKKFNADTAISYSINLKSQDYYQGKYNNLWVLMIQKKDKGFLRMYCFYENISKKKLAKYKAEIEKVFSYTN